MTRYRRYIFESDVQFLVIDDNDGSVAWVMDVAASYGLIDRHGGVASFIETNINEIDYYLNNYRHMTLPGTENVSIILIDTSNPPKQFGTTTQETNHE